MNFYQIFLPIYMLAMLLLVFVLRSVMVWRQTGINPFVFGKSHNAHDYVGQVYKVLSAATFVVILIYALKPQWYLGYLLPMHYLMYPNLQLAGVALLLISLIWIIIAQYQMSASWRIGIDYEEKTELVIAGLFNYSRNPIFLGVLLSYLGTFLIIPNAFTLMLMVACYITIQIQVRIEEEYLQATHGDSYTTYQNKVRRWL